MSDDNRKLFRETSRWIRVGFLTISVLGPVIETLASRLRQRSTAVRDEAAKRGVGAYQQSQERLAATGAAIADTVSNLRDDAYRQGLLKRSSDLTENLVGRSSKLSQTAIERSSKVGRDLAERGSQATQTAIELSNDVLQDLTDRSEKASRELAKRTEQVSKDIKKRGEQVSKEVRRQSKRASRELQRRSRATQRELTKRTVQLTQQRPQSNPFLLIFGFSISLIAAGIAVYLLIKNRLDRYAHEQQMSFQNNSLNGTGLFSNTANVERPTSQSSITLVEPVTEPTLAEPVVDSATTTEPELDENEPATEKMPIISIQGTINGQATTEEAAEESETAAATSDEASQAEQAAPSDDAYVVPPDAKFLGVVSTKTYHPIETPLDTLPTPESGTLEVIYFVTADEAQEQGYIAAQL